MLCNNQQSFLYLTMTNTKPQNTDEYIATFPKATQEILEQIRAIIKELAPAAEETFSYNMPTFNLNDQYLIYFAGFKNHVSIYPVPTGNEELEEAFESYKTSGKGTIQFPLNKPLPIDLIKKIILFRVKESAKKNTAKKAKS